MGALTDKILTYTPEQLYTFNETYRLAPTNLGNGGTPANFTLSNEAPTYISSGGIFDEGYWTFHFGTASGDTSTTRYRNISTSSAQLNSELTDNNFSTGFWFKANGTLLDSTAHATTHEIAFLGGGNSGIRPGIRGGVANNVDKGKLYVTVVGGNDVYSSNRIDDGSWHYFAGIQTTDGTNNTVSIYLDGSLVNTQTYSRIGSTAQLSIGNTSVSPNPYEITGFNISNFYIAPPSSINATAIAEIWTAGSSAGGTDITITETPATASALMTEPTIAITANDHVEITTSIIVSAEFPSNINAGGEQNVNNIISETLDASTDIVNNVVVIAGANIDYIAAEMTATSELIEPLPFVTPMTAIALMVNPIIYVSPNYRALVKALNPSFYLNNPGGDPNLVPTAINDGNDNWGAGVVDSGVRKYASTSPLDFNGNGYFYGIASSSSVSSRQISFTSSTAIAASEYFNQPGATNSNDFSIEFWYYAVSTSPGSIINFGLTEVLINNNILTFKMIGDEIAGDGFDPTFTHTQALDLALNNWHYIVITVDFSDVTANTVSQIWHNATFKSQRVARFVKPTLIAGDADGIIFNDNGGLLGLSEMAVYKSVLSNSDIVEHYTFMTTNSPNVVYNAEPIATDADSGNHNFLVTSDVNYPELAVTASVLIVDPIIFTQKNLVTFATPLEASALNTDAEVYWGWTILASPAFASAFKPEAYFLKTTYSNYVQANIAPYRYVTFDAADTSFDYGTDSDYSVVPTVVGGTIVNPDLGINGKSAKTAGTSYITDGVILKESEWNDSWGTGENSYHSAFWFQRALDDSSTTGLRVLWNLNGYKDNQHVVLYQYQDKLHVQFNNGLGTWVEQDTGTLDLFDYNRHFVVINFNHTNPVNNIVSLYVDSILKMTVNLGEYTGTTTNATTADSGPNDELNNHPRLSVGCLITPFASTALPVVPTNTKLIIDEIYWDKNSIDQTTVTNLFNIMPDKDNVDFVANIMTASDELVMPTYSVSSNLLIAPFTASAELLEPLTTADREVIYNAEIMTANALMGEAVLFEDRTLSADLFIATAIFDDAGVVISIPGGPMLATAKLATNIGFKHYDDDGDFINIVPLSDNLTPLIRYVRVDALNNRIPNLMEVK